MPSELVTQAKIAARGKRRIARARARLRRVRQVALSARELKSARVHLRRMKAKYKVYIISSASDIKAYIAGSDSEYAHGL